MSETLALAQLLISRPSVTPDDHGCQALIADRLRTLGFAVEPMRFGNVDNLWAKRGNSAPVVVLAGHTDVVPTGPLDAWHSPPFTPTIRDACLYGRGAADMKTAVAGMITAIERFVAQRPGHRGSIAVLFTSDEEGPAVDGTAKVLDTLTKRGERVDYAMVGEPTSSETFGDTIKNGRRGSLSGSLTIHGVQGHVAYPHLAKNPVHWVAPALAELAATQWDEGNAFFPPTTWQVSNFHAGTGANNVIPGNAEIHFNFRFSTASTADSLQSRVHAVLDRHGLDYTLEWTLGAKPFVTARGRLTDTLRAAVQEIVGIEPELSTSGGTSDARFFAEVCEQVVEFGPINASIHKLNEHIALKDVEPLSRIYERVLEKLLLAK